MLLFLLACDVAERADGAPSVGGLALVPGAPVAGDRVVVTVTGSSGALTYAWFRDGTPTGGAGPVFEGELTKGSLLAVTVTATVGERAAHASVEATVGNTPPTAPGVAIEAVDDGYACVVVAEAFDADGDPVTYSTAWSTDGASVGGAALSWEASARGTDWACAVVADDGEAEGPAGTATISLEGPVPGGYAFEEVLDITMPADIAPLPDGTLLIATLLGDLVHVDPAAPAVTGTATLYAPDDLIAVAIDPRFGDGAHDLVYTWTNHTCVLARHAITTDPFTVVSSETLVTLECPLDGGHAGGDLLFWEGESAEPVLYLAVGPTIRSNPQDETHPGQKLLAYAIADDGTVTPGVESPFANPYVVALGLRNAWRLADCGSVICIADPGSTGYEEVDLYASAGHNFGYPRVEGPGDGTFDEPAVWWADDDDSYAADDRDGNGRTGFVHSPVVGVRATAAGYGGRLAGHLLYGDVYDGWIRAAPVDDAGVVGPDVPIASLPFTLGMAESPDGTLWAASMSGGLWRLGYRADRATVGDVGARLSDASPAGTAYAVRYPLWSNGAEKDRAIELPAGSTIDTSDPDAWVFPDGTRLWKHFSVDGAPVESRLLEKRDGAWVAGVYVWQGDDAYLSDGSRTDLVLPSGAAYTVPSERACFTCHGATVGKDAPLGIEPFQLGDAGLGSLADHFSADPGSAPQVASDDPTEVAMRGYLHGNCAYCHQPAGVVSFVSVIGLDLRYSATETGLLDAHAEYWHANPNANDGIPLVIPGDPDGSALVGMLEDSDMPPVAVWAPDTAAIATIRAWITGLAP
jgi:hypothetical protein